MSKTGEDYKNGVPSGELEKQGPETIFQFISNFVKASFITLGNHHCLFRGHDDKRTITLPN